MPTTFNILRDALVELGVDADLVTPTAELRQDLGVDSTEVVEIAATAAAALTRRPDSKALKGVRTVEELAATVEAFAPVDHVAKAAA